MTRDIIPFPNPDDENSCDICGESVGKYALIPLEANTMASSIAIKFV